MFGHFWFGDPIWAKKPKRRFGSISDGHAQCKWDDWACAEVDKNILARVKGGPNFPYLFIEGLFGSQIWLHYS